MSRTAAYPTGQDAPFTVDAYPGITFHGQVNDIRKAPISAQNVVTYDVVIAASKHRSQIVPGDDGQRHNLH